MMRVGRVAFVLGTWMLAAASGACGGPAFEAATGDAGEHGVAANLDGSTGRVSADGGPGDAAADGPASCSPLPDGATDIYVDQRFTGTQQYGVNACPFTTILQATAAASNRTGSVTIHVAGSTPALVYSESGPVPVSANVTLVGDGPAKTTIHATGTCSTRTCAVIVSAGGIVDGFTIASPGGDGIVAMAGTPAPVLQDLAADGSKTFGVTAFGAVELGPNFSASSNGAGGVESPVTASGRVHINGMSNAFDNNTGNGIDMNGSAVLLFEGGTANGNFQGIRLAGTPSPGAAAHTITNLTASGNTGPGGVVAYSGQTITMRSSTLVGNTTVGLLYTYANGSVLDIGSSAAGGNVFGGVTAAKRNGKGGIRLCAVPALVTASGDDWSSCPPTQTSLACDATLPTTYSDIFYAAAGASVGAVGALTVTSCQTGP